MKGRERLLAVGAVLTFAAGCSNSVESVGTVTLAPTIPATSSSETQSPNKTSSIPDDDTAIRQALREAPAGQTITAKNLLIGRTIVAPIPGRNWVTTTVRAVDQPDTDLIAEDYNAPCLLQAFPTIPQDEKGAKKGTTEINTRADQADFTVDEHIGPITVIDFGNITVNGETYSCK